MLRTTERVQLPDLDRSIRTFKSTHEYDTCACGYYKQNNLQLKLKFMELFFVRGKYDNNGNTTNARITDSENLEKCIKEIKWEFGVKTCYVNKAVMTIAGYFNNGEYVGEY